MIRYNKPPTGWRSGIHLATRSLKKPLIRGSTPTHTEPFGVLGQSLQGFVPHSIKPLDQSVHWAGYRVAKYNTIIFQCFYMLIFIDTCIRIQARIDTPNPKFFYILYLLCTCSHFIKERLLSHHRRQSVHKEFAHHKTFWAKSIWISIEYL